MKSLGSRVAPFLAQILAISGIRAGLIERLDDYLNATVFAFDDVRELVGLGASDAAVVRNIHRPPQLALLNSRTTLCWLRGPMTRGDLKRLKGEAEAPVVAADAVDVEDG